MVSPWGKSLQAALVFTGVFALSGFLVILSLGGGPPGPEETRLLSWGPAIAGLSGFFTTLVMWWAIVARARTARVRRGLIAGLTSGVLVHPVCWPLYSAGNSLLIVLGMSSRSPLGQLPLTLRHEMVAVFKFSVLSLIFFGWVTALVGALTGGLLAIWQNTASVPDGAQAGGAQGQSRARG
jgi:hypothetical protein